MKKNKFEEDDSPLAVSPSMKEDIKREEELKEINMFSHWDEDIENMEEVGIFDHLLRDD